MKNHIYSTFDLSKSLEHFQEKVTKLLELTNISEWDGHVFREREKKIREIALVLAGECTALLLHNLSQSQDFLDKAEQETQGWWQTSTKKHGCKERQILTVGNVAVTLKLPYVVERQTQPKKNQKSLHEGFCPFLRYLGMSEGLTPRVLSTIARYGAIAGSFEAARTTLIDWGINISLKRIERLTYYFGKIGINLRQSKLTSLALGSLATSNVLKEQRVVIAVDGGRTRIRINNKGRRKVKTNRLGFTGEWIEPKLLTIYVVNEEGKKIINGEIPITNDGTYSGYQGFLQILEMYLVNLGISQAKQVLLIADGADWIWIHIPPLLKKLKCPPDTYQLLDFYHAASHLQDFADAAFNTNNERQQWFQKARKTLKKGQTLSLIRKMDEFIQGATGERLKNLLRERNYILKAYRRRLLKYNEVGAKKLPLGSGAVESLIRQVVNLRMKGNSKFWLQDNAEIMLHLRCQWIAKSWDNFSDSIFNSFIKPQSC
ncbi:ISLre2 family transposase [Komarekiella sp. 'clone 1']|uniref:ISLre2 family transposase n=1 Tax=Komarekiella delphini-convector SJRDD-AB1 TaxID=2593771 RepID=A0AA40T3A4_9NOST|nr:ISLre2 family transposase [Komarekiella delphini-convector]MBD6619854.1 ISLre2 family transposase [Komarekiella delphini-convector SJRDD-AB1]